MYIYFHNVVCILTNDTTVRINEVRHVTCCNMPHVKLDCIRSRSHSLPILKFSEKQT